MILKSLIESQVPRKYLNDGFLSDRLVVLSFSRPLNIAGLQNFGLSHVSETSVPSTVRDLSI